MRRGPENKETMELVVFLEKTSRKNASGLWRRIAAEIARPRRARVEVNVGKLGRLTRAGDIVVIPGKILGSGSLSHSLTVAALSFAKSAREKIKNAGGKILTLREAASSHPKGTGLKLLS
ncbi:MAG: 50S ribosomal protein L18e [Candidatus Micrarchaeia archaeon]